MSVECCSGGMPWVKVFFLFGTDVSRVFFFENADVFRFWCLCSIEPMSSD